MTNKKDEEIDQLINIIESMIPLTVNNASEDLQNAWRKVVIKHKYKGEVCRHKVPLGYECRNCDAVSIRKKIENET